MSGAGDRTAVEHLLGRYFDALYHGDARALGEVLHPTAIYATATSGELLRLSMADYLPLVAARSKPSEAGEIRSEEIVSIDLVGGTMGLAKVRCALFGRDYVDLLSLLKVDGRWWVLAKVFHYDQRSQ